jgi:FkbM family methyltransferase
MKVVPHVARLLAGPWLGVLSRHWHRYAPSVAVRRGVFGFSIYYDLRDNPYYWASSRRHLEEGEPIFELLKRPPCQVWDVGSNVGLFSMRAAEFGHNVVSFDISDKALGLLSRSAHRNRFDVKTVNRAFSVAPMRYRVPAGCMADNRMLPPAGDAGDRHSIPFEEAAAKFGVPALIKMDIEGGEGLFFDSPVFKRWILGHGIQWIVEIHSPEYFGKLWSDVSALRLDHSHVLINVADDAPRT